jgi:hypothetical protein
VSRSLNGQTINPHPTTETDNDRLEMHVFDEGGKARTETVDEIANADEETDCSVDADFECPDGDRCMRPDCAGSHGPNDSPSGAV